MHILAVRISVFTCETFSGIFLGRRPTLFIIDPDLIKAVTTRDFEYFMDRNSIETNEPRYLKRSLLNLKVIMKKLFSDTYFLLIILTIILLPVSEATNISLFYMR